MISSKMPRKEFYGQSARNSVRAPSVSNLNHRQRISMNLNTPSQLSAVDAATRLGSPGLGEIGCAMAELHELQPFDERCTNHTWPHSEVANER